MLGLIGHDTALGHEEEGIGSQVAHKFDIVGY